MTLKQWQINKIIELFGKGFGVEAIAKIRRHSKNTIKKYLRLYGYLPYPTDSYIKPSQQGDWFYQELRKKDEALTITKKKKHLLEQQVDDANQKLDQKNADYQELKMEHANTLQQLEDSERRANSYKEQLETKNQQIEVLRAQQKSDAEKYLQMQTEKEKATQLLTLFEADKSKPLTPEHPKQTIEPPQISLTPTNVEPPLEEESDEDSIAIDGPLLLASLMSAATITLSVYAALKNPQKVLGGTPQRIIPCFGFGRGAGIICPSPLNKIIRASEPIPMQYFNSDADQNKPLKIISGLGNIQGIEDVGTPEANISGTVSSGAFSLTTQENTNIEYTVNPQQDLHQGDNHSDVTIENSSKIQCSGPFFSSHLDSIISQDTPPVQTPSSFQIPPNYTPYIPFPTYYNDISEIYPLNKWKRTTGKGFETCIEKLFIHKGCPTERLPYGNYAGDLIVTLNGVITLIECKQKPIVRVETIQRTRGAMEHYRNKGVTQCMVITTGEFTKEAIEEARKIKVVLWGGKQLLEEIYKAQFFYVPEDASDYDPDK